MTLLREGSQWQPRCRSQSSPQHRSLPNLLYVALHSLKLLVPGEDACERHQVMPSIEQSLNYIAEALVPLLCFSDVIERLLDGGHDLMAFAGILSRDKE